MIEVRRRFAGDALGLQSRQSDELAAPGEQGPLVDPGPIGQLFGQRSGFVVALRGGSDNGRHSEASSPASAIRMLSNDSGRLAGS